MSVVPEVSAQTRRGVPVDPTLRLLAVGTFVNRAGGGVLVTVFALFFTRHTGLTAAQVGLALSVAAAVGLLTQVPAGQLGDHFGPRSVLVASMLGSGVASLGLLVVRDFVPLVLVLVVTTVLQTSAGSVRNGYIARIAVGATGVAFKAYLRAVTNVAMAFGALLGGLALAVDRPWAYLAAFALDSTTTIWAALVTLRLPHVPPAPGRADGEPRLAVVRDRPYVAATLLSGILSMHFVVMELGIPLWISEHTRAPRSMVAVLLVLNTVVVALFQVRVARGAGDVTSSTRAILVGAVWIAGAFVLISWSDGTGPVVAAVLLLLGGAVHVIGEMVSSAGQWGVSMGLAPHERQGQYQGFNSLGFGLASTVAPALIAFLVVGWGRPGWYVLAGLVLGSALLLVPVSRWALRTRERYGAASASG